MEAFLRLSELGGCGFLSKDSALLCVTPSVPIARLFHRAETYKKLLWSSLKARSLLLRLRHKEKDPSVRQLCHQLSALIVSSGLPSSPELREMQMEVSGVHRDVYLLGTFWCCVIYIQIMLSSLQCTHLHVPCEVNCVTSQ